MYDHCAAQYLLTAAFAGNKGNKFFKTHLFGEIKLAKLYHRAANFRHQITKLPSGTNYACSEFAAPAPLVFFNREIQKTGIPVF
ncbi:hypothetical protein C7N43_25525 [Sphingobacteriales bacterium UPWRP_1]|nr:hypothetical protein C7N43_25525 [Sphingobacteriales bacterium UPWRP_1]